MTKLKDISGYESGLEKIFFDYANAEVGIDEEYLKEFLLKHSSIDKSSSIFFAKLLAHLIVQNESKILRIK